MPEDHELKTKVDEKTHDDILVASRMYGFANKAEFLRWLVKKELYGVTPLIQLNRIPGGCTGRD